MKQILLITDGCSNSGVSPVVAAAQARSRGLVVNVVGVIDEGDIGERGAAEIAEIAEAGGGMSRIVPLRALAETVQMMTRKTVVQTIHQAVQREIRHIMGPEAALEKLPPERRGPIVRVIDDLSETSPLRVALLIDTSASMRPKLKAAQDACRDLLASLRARKGRSEMAVLHFPGSSEADVLVEWTADLAKIGDLFYNLNMKGTTPTGPALVKAAWYILDYGTADRTAVPEDRREAGRAARASGGDGVWSDYIV